jgi:hypothetical protein
MQIVNKIVTYTLSVGMLTTYDAPTVHYSHAEMIPPALALRGLLLRSDEMRSFGVLHSHAIKWRVSINTFDFLIFHFVLSKRGL